MAELKKINDTTFSADDLGDVKPKVKIGGNDEKKFIPNLNASFFDDEFYFNLNRKDKAGVSTAIEAKITGDDTDEWYIDKDGRLKWDIIFDSCPENLTLEWELKHADGIEFIYQGELTEQEIKDGCVRPDEVIGSYAVYCNKANNKYKTGKLTHIYRPFVIDADGAREWATLLIEKGKLTITLPEEFMETAKYPVRLDPEFGYTSIGGSDDLKNRDELPYGCITDAYTATTGDTITSFSFYGAAYSATATVEMAAYSMSGDNLVSRLGDIATISVNSTSYQWWTTATISREMSNGVKYAPALYCNTSNYIWVKNDGGSNQPRHGTAESLPSTWSSTTTINKKYSMYATYTEGGGAVANSYYYMMNQ